MLHHTKSSILQSLIGKPDPEKPDWRLLCDLLRLDLTNPVAEAHLAGLLRALTRSIAAGLWDQHRPKSLEALSGSNIRDKALPRFSCFAYALALGEFSASPVSAEDLPASWRADSWPQPWFIAYPAARSGLLLFVLYATRPSNDLMDHLKLLLPAVADCVSRRAALIGLPRDLSPPPG